VSWRGRRNPRPVMLEGLVISWGLESPSKVP